VGLKHNLKIEISGMTCPHCEAKARNAFDQLGAGEVMEVSHEQAGAFLQVPVFTGEAAYREAIEGAGYSTGEFLVDGAIELHVSGMHCQNCVAAVTKLTLETPGVDSVTVDLDAGIVSIVGGFSLTALGLNLTQAGYPFQTLNESFAESSNQPSTPPSDEPTTTASTGDPAPDSPSGLAKKSDAGTSHQSVVQLSVDGMSCASCVRSVESALLGVKGTTSAAVNFAGQSATVMTSAPLEALQAAIKAAGYSALPQQTENSDERLAQLETDLKHSTLQSGIALVVGSLLMLGMWFDLFPPLANVFFWMTISLVVAAVMVYSGGHFFRSAWTAAKHRLATMDSLIVLGTSTAWFYSTMIILWPELVPGASRHLFFEAAVLIIGFVNLGKALENNAKGKTSLAIGQLLNLTPNVATKVMTNDKGSEEEIEVLVSSLKVDDLVRIKPGQAIPVDGLVITGETSVDESMLTGESIPAEKGVGASVVAGTINQYGVLLIQAKQVGDQTVLASIVKLTREAQNSKPRIGRITDRIAAVFVPFVIVTSILTALAWLMFGPEPSQTYAVTTAMAVLIIACPCALGLAIPMSIMVGIGRAASEGLLIRNSDALQAAAGLTTIIMDKTGTLTQGKPGITKFEVSESYQDGKYGVLRIAYSLEKLSEHPLANAVVAYCNSEGAEVPVAKVSDFQILPGGGVAGEIDGEKVAIGNAGFMAANNMNEVSSVIAGKNSAQDSKNSNITEAVENAPAETRIFVGLGTEIIGSFYLVDQVKDDSLKSVQRLQAMGLKVVMLTGDSHNVARSIGEQLGLEDVVSEVSPEQKLAYIRELQSQGEKVGMVGDGINDTLALSTADVGFAMGAGTDVAMESADITLLKNSVGGVGKAIMLSRYCLRNIYQNLAGAFGYNLLLIPVAAGALYPWFGVLINPAFAGVAMAASSITVVSNANRLRFKKI